MQEWGETGGSIKEGGDKSGERQVWGETSVGREK